MPDWVADKQARLAKICQAKAELEAEAKAKAAAEPPARAKVDEKPPRKPPPASAPEPKAQRNFTDPESRILKTKDGYIQGYNAQAAVDAHAQIIVAHTLGNNGSDQNQFAPLLDAIKTNLGSNPHEVSADAGYCSTANLRTLSRRRIKGYIATGRVAAWQHRSGYLHLCCKGRAFMSEERDDQERPCLHCMMVELIDEFFAEYPATTGEPDTIDTDEVVTAIAKTVAELTCGQDGTIRQQLIEQLVHEVMNYDAEFCRDAGTGAIGSDARR